MKTKIIDLYTLDEIQAQFPKVYQKILDNNRYIDITDCFQDDAFNWYGCTLSDYTGALEKIGFSDIKFSFSGFSSQGDGASFVAKYHAPETFPVLPEETPTSIKYLANVLKGYTAQFPGLYFNITRDTHHYSHENTVSPAEICQDNDTETIGDCPEYDAIYRDIRDRCRDVMREYYRALEKDYDSLTSDANIAENLEANDYYFDDTGKIVNPDE